MIGAMLMRIDEFIKHFTNHPILFIGTGMSLRYLENSYTWDGLLRYISKKLKGTEEYYYDLKSRHEVNGEYNFPEIAKELENEFNIILVTDRNGVFKNINDLFYSNMEKGINISRFKLFIASLLKDFEIRVDKIEEVNELKKVRKNIGSVITTNYDGFIEDIFEFKPLIGNDILLSNPYGSVYKIHGCVDDPGKIIITSSDYERFDKKYELIRAQLLSLFIHNPIIFLGYNIGDANIKSILKTIFTYINPNTPDAEKIRQNFLLVEYEEGSQNVQVVDHDIDMSEFGTIRTNKIKTDNFLEIYEHLAKLNLPVSAMDIRKVQSVVKEIYAGGNISVSITEDIEALKNGEKVLAIGSIKTIKYEYQTTSEIMENYFKITDESNNQLLKLIDKQRIQATQFFPIFGFGLIQTDLNSYERLKGIQLEKIRKLNESTIIYRSMHTTIQEIIADESIPQTSKNNSIISAIFDGNLCLIEVEDFLRNYSKKKATDYRRLLCVYDFVKYGIDDEEALRFLSEPISVVQ